MVFQGGVSQVILFQIQAHTYTHTHTHDCHQIGTHRQAAPSNSCPQEGKHLPVTAAFFLSLLLASSMSIDLSSQNQPCP